jgi:hypothetical protein
MSPHGRVHVEESYDSSSLTAALWRPGNRYLAVLISRYGLDGNSRVRGSCCARHRRGGCVVYGRLRTMPRLFCHSPAGYARSGLRRFHAPQFAPGNLPCALCPMTRQYCPELPGATTLARAILANSNHTRLSYQRRGSAPRMAAQRAAGGWCRSVVGSWPLQLLHKSGMLWGG